ncbi:Tn3 family transposase [Streptomyces galilaeus]|uniref:Tn3 family transposase n=1 Tax=Streptomyces galilaeus TaxID=33899 RepID=UPI0016723AF7
MTRYALQPTRTDVTRRTRDEQEMFVLCLRILQSALVYVNTLMLQDVLGESEWADLLTPADRRGKTRASGLVSACTGRSTSTWTPVSILLRPPRPALGSLWTTSRPHPGTGRRRSLRRCRQFGGRAVPKPAACAGRRGR